MAKKILIVDDEAPLMTVLVERFNQEGFEVIVAKNGQEGLDNALKSHPDMILLDIIMPVMDGMTMLSELRKDSWGATANVIFLSNLSEPERIDQSINYGVRDYLVKCDWTLEDIVKKVRERLGIK